MSSATSSSAAPGFSRPAQQFGGGNSQVSFKLPEINSLISKAPERRVNDCMIAVVTARSTQQHEETLTKIEEEAVGAEKGKKNEFRGTTQLVAAESATTTATTTSASGRFVMQKLPLYRGRDMCGPFRVLLPSGDRARLQADEASQVELDGFYTR